MEPQIRRGQRPLWSCASKERVICAASPLKARFGETSPLGACGRPPPACQAGEYVQWLKPRAAPLLLLPFACGEGEREERGEQACGRGTSLPPHKATGGGEGICHSKVAGGAQKISERVTEKVKTGGRKKKANQAQNRVRIGNFAELWDDSDSISISSMLVSSLFFCCGFTGS